MSGFTSLIIILLAMLIQSFLQTSPALFAIFYHHSLAKTSTKKADDRALSFILGVEICIAALFLVTYFVISFFIAEENFTNATFLWVMSGIFALEAIFIFCFYFRPRFVKTNGKTLSKSSAKNSTMLFLPRHVTNGLVRHAERAGNRSDTIMLGLSTCLLEIFFTLPLYIIMSVEIFNISINFGFVFIIAYIIMATVPLFVIRTFYRTGRNLAEIQRARARLKWPVRLVLSLSYLIIAIILCVAGFSI